MAGSVDAAVHDADVVITCTGSQSALVRGEWLKLGAHVTAVGSDAPDKQELDPSLPARADLLVVDSRRQASEIGELHHALAAGLIDERKAVELGEICARTHPGRTSASQLTVCDLTGVGVQDVAAANVVMANAGDRARSSRCSAVPDQPAASRAASTSSCTRPFDDTRLPPCTGGEPSTCVTRPPASVTITASGAKSHSDSSGSIITSAAPRATSMWPQKSPKPAVPLRAADRAASARRPRGVPAHASRSPKTTIPAAVVATSDTRISRPFQVAPPPFVAA